MLSQQGGKVGGWDELCEGINTVIMTAQPGGHSTRSEIDIDSDDDTESEVERKPHQTNSTAIVTVIEAREIRNWILFRMSDDAQMLS